MPSFWEGVTRFLPGAQDMADAADEPPPRLPPGFEWCRVDLDDPELLRLLQGHYVDADGGRLRLLVTREMLEWTLGGPARLPGNEGLVGVRATRGARCEGEVGRLVACVSCTPARVLVDGRRERVGLVSHMCVHRKLRNKRLTPVLVREITRVGWAHGLASGLSTSARRLHAPLLRARYHQRVLDADALVRSGFLPRCMAPFVGGSKDGDASADADADASADAARPLRDDDVPWAAGLLRAQAGASRLSLDWSDAEEARHRLLPRGDTVFSYVIEEASFVSFYAMPVSVLDTGAEARMAYLHAWGGPASIETLLAAAARLATGPGRCHMLNALDIGACTPAALRRAGFSSGADVFFHAAHCTWAPTDIAPADSGLVLP
jgi:glycylpeptide N-tetradecanoyltransferase